MATIATDDGTSSAHRALQVRPQGQHVLPFDGERAVVGERGVGFSFRDFLSAREPEKR